MEERRWHCLVTNLPGFLACENALLGTLAAGQEKDGELATTSLEFEIHLQLPCGSPSTELSDFCQSARAETSANVNKHWKTRAMGTNVISAKQHFATTFSTQIFKLQRRSSNLSSLFPFRRQSAPESLLPGYCFWHVNDHTHRFVHMGIAWFARK